MSYIGNDERASGTFTCFDFRGGSERESSVPARRPSGVTGSPGSFIHRVMRRVYIYMHRYAYIYVPIYIYLYIYRYVYPAYRKYIDIPRTS